MNRIAWTIVVASLLSFSCVRESLSENDIARQGTISACVEKESRVAISDDSTAPGTKYHTWQAGDRISVLTGTKNLQYTLVSGAGTKYGAFSGTAFEETAGYTALYPYNESATLSESSISVEYGAKQSFTTDSYDPAACLMVARNDGTKSGITFHPIVSFVRFTITSDKDTDITKIQIMAQGGETITGKATVDCSSDNPTVSMDGKGNSYIEMDIPKGLAIEGGEALTFYAALPPVTLSEGYTLAIFDGEGNVMFRKCSTTTYPQNRLLSMPELKYVPTAAYLVENSETANCYVVRKAGTYAFPTNIKGNGVAPNSESTTLGHMASTQVLWQDAGVVDGNATLYGHYAVFSTPASPENGNAVIATKGTDGKTAWSWHIWYAPDMTSVDIGTRSFMNMALGAKTKNSSSATVAYTDGCNYQWGRKDPFEFGYFTTTSTQVTMDTAIANPTILYLTNKTKPNWNTEYTYMDWGWDGSTDNVFKTMYDPSPSGYHIPSKSALTELAGEAATSLENNGLWFGGNALFLPNYCTIHYIYGTVTDTSRYVAAENDKAAKPKCSVMSFSTTETINMSYTGYTANGFNIVCEKDSEEKPGFKLSDVHYPLRADVGVSYRYFVYATGLQSGDGVRFCLQGSETVYDATAAYYTDRLEAVIPTGFVSGNYDVYVTRGEKKVKLGTSILAVSSHPKVVTPTVIAHRGCHINGEPDNSIASLNGAQKQEGLYGVEFDVWITTDGVTVVYHDASIGGVTIQTATYDQIKDKTLSNGEKLPTLDAYLTELKKTPNLMADVQIKKHSTETRTNICADSAIAMIKRKDMVAQCNYTPGLYSTAVRMAADDSKPTVRYANSSIYVSTKQCKADGIPSIQYKNTLFFSDPSWITSAHADGLTVCIWTLDTVELIQKAAAMGCDYILSNKCELRDEARRYKTVDYPTD